ncbi:uncharacterized protein PV09_06581 [Verruconis gallopava]|uniref:Conidiation-specific protein 8 n=1 Tax=Verruconis gallopava TaxID=253628 RepID=A0A0D2ASE2_9PEZI|nr:uncharacterized protein PV09_06581 [Verruconis gallopava]KIW02089.1 hypothetical protein PV09_06581 [Verruconis gallopava]
MSSPNSGERRRSSGTFANLMNLKRNPNDEASMARRLSQTEAYQKPGFLGSMWNSWTKGHPPPSSPPKDAAKPADPAKQSIHRTGAGTLG